jgi:hypothetical protein
MTVMVVQQPPSIGYTGRCVAQSVETGCMIKCWGRDRCVGRRYPFAIAAGAIIA